MTMQIGEATASRTPDLLEQLQKLVERFGLIIAGLVALAGSAASFWSDYPREIRWGVVAVATVALLFVVVGKVAMPAIEQRRRARIIKLPEGALIGPKLFRLRPYDEGDHDAFDRPDAAHHDALRWVRVADDRFLYLTGFSGTGKSSLLHAWLVPELAKADPPVKVVVARSYGDPLRQLIEALSKPGVVWKERAPAEPDARALLERAAERVRPARLLVAIDQFEECLILQDEAGRKQLADLFASLREQPIANAGFLLTLRTDYLDLDALRALALPDVQSDRNWFNLNALSRGEARAFLDQRLKLDEQMREKVIDEASEVDDLPGLVRPITLNMLGLVLQRYRGGTLEGAPPGRLIQSYLRQAMAKPGIDDLAPRLLGEMITDKGTKRPLDESALAERTTSSAGFVRKCLLLLAQEGVVRELEPEQRVWEISHDFVARQLSQIIPRLRPSLYRRAQARLAPVALVAWLVLLPALAIGGPEIMERYARNVLSDEGVRIPWSDQRGGYEVDFSSANSGAFGRVHNWLRWLRPIHTVKTANDPDLIDLSPIHAVIEPGELTQLSISDNDGLQALPGWEGLGSLTQLSIVNNSDLQALPRWQGLPKLEEVRLSGPFRAEEVLRQLKDLPSLRSVMLPDDPAWHSYTAATNAERTKSGLQPIAFRFEAPLSDAWWSDW